MRVLRCFRGMCAGFADEHTRRRSPYNLLVHLLAGLTAYCHQPKKPSLHLALDSLRVKVA